MTTYLGPAETLTLEGKEVHPGDECAIDEPTQRALEGSGHMFDPMLTGMAPQSATENLAEEGTTPEKQARSSGISKA